MSEKFNIVKKGYDIEEVNKYISTLENVIKSYKEKDTAIKNAIINAQIAADNIITTAEMEADAIAKETNRKLERIFGTIEKQKGYIKSFQEDYNKMVNKYLHEFNDSEVLKVYIKLNELEDHIVALQNDEKNNDTVDTKQNLAHEDKDGRLELTKFHEKRLGELMEEEIIAEKTTKESFSNLSMNVDEDILSQHTRMYTKVNPSVEEIEELYYKKNGV